MNVLSLFDGCSCGQVALERAGIEVDNYFASEIDKYAIKIAQKNYPDTIQLGDIEQIDTSKLPEIDLLIGGSPCQGFSNSGKGLNFEDPRSKLFFEYVRLLEVLKPKWYLLENVKMKKEWRDIITSYMGVQPVLINSSMFSAQNRERYYWTNIPIGVIVDKNIKLYEVLEDIHGDRPCELVKCDHKTLCHRIATATDVNGHDYNKRVYGITGKSPTLIASSGGNLEPKILIVPEATVKGYATIYPNEAADLTFLNSKTRRGRRMVHKSNCVSASNDVYGMWDGFKYRKITMVEFERLQTLPDNYTEGVSYTQRKKMIGNGWTVDVIAHILRGMEL